MHGHRFPIRAVLACTVIAGVAFGLSASGTLEGNSGVYAIQQNDTSYDMNVLVLMYLPLTPDGQEIDLDVTGPFINPPYAYAEVRQDVIDLTTALQEALENSTTYLGYSDPSAPSSLRYHIVDTIEYDEPFPILPGFVNDYYYFKLLSDLDICDYVNNQGVQEVWIWGYTGIGPRLRAAESKMSGPFGDISNSLRVDDMPYCGHTYRTYTLDYGNRTTALAVHSWSHQIEVEMDAVDSTFFRDIWQGPPGVFPGRCGSVHYPPNGVQDYDYSNLTPRQSDCLDWNPDGLGQLSSIDCHQWDCVGDSYSTDHFSYLVWNWQNLPGHGNTKTYQGKSLRNFWDIHGDFDNVLGNDRTLFLGGPTPSSTPLLTSTPAHTPIDQTPTPTPGPTPAPGGGVMGDVDCDEDVNSVDALFVLRDVAGLSSSQCIDHGDVDCDGARDAVDALLVLRHVAELPVNQPLGCTVIGSEY